MSKAAGVLASRRPIDFQYIFSPRRGGLLNHPWLLKTPHLSRVTSNHGSGSSRFSGPTFLGLKGSLFEEFSIDVLRFRCGHMFAEFAVAYVEKFFGLHVFIHDFHGFFSLYMMFFSFGDEYLLFYIFFMRTYVFSWGVN